MNKAILIVILFSSLGMASFLDEKVFVCISPNEKVYHIDEKCPALKRCKHDIIEVTKVGAIGEYHRVLCEIE